MTPISINGVDSTPTLRISGVSNGDAVRVFTDSTCTAGNQVAMGTASGKTIDLTTSPLAGTSFTFYATRTNSTPQTSLCSTVSVTYNLVSCPSNYLVVGGNSTLGFMPFV